MIGRQDFRRCFTRSLYLAAIVFALAHLLQTLAIDFFSRGSLQTNPAAVVVLLSYVVADATIFFVVGWPVAFWPGYLIGSLLNRLRRRRLVVYASFGLALGLIFLPLCASVAFLVMHVPDDPTFPARCVEFAYPMGIAGTIGGYAFWRFTRGMAQDRERMVDQFS